MHFLGVVKEANLIKHYNIKIVKKKKKTRNNTTETLITFYKIHTNIVNLIQYLFSFCIQHIY